MSFASLSRLYVNEYYKEKPKYTMRKCKIINIADNLSCLIKIESKKYILYLKSVPKKKILKNYLKYLCGKTDIFVRILEEHEQKSKEVDNVTIILGSLFTSDKININRVLIRRFNYLKKKYIYERTIINNIYRKRKNIWYPYHYLTPYKTVLTPIKEEE